MASMKGIVGKRVRHKYLFTELEIYLSPQWPWQFKMVAQFPAHLRGHHCQPPSRWDMIRL